MRNSIMNEAYNLNQNYQNLLLKGTNFNPDNKKNRNFSISKCFDKKKGYPLKIPTEVELEIHQFQNDLLQRTKKVTNDLSRIQWKRNSNLFTKIFYPNYPKISNLTCSLDFVLKYTIESHIDFKTRSGFYARRINFELNLLNRMINLSEKGNECFVSSTTISVPVKRGAFKEDKSEKKIGKSDSIENLGDHKNRRKSTVTFGPNSFLGQQNRTTSTFSHNSELNSSVNLEEALSQVSSEDCMQCQNTGQYPCDICGGNGLIDIPEDAAGEGGADGGGEGGSSSGGEDEFGGVDEGGTISMPCDICHMTGERQCEACNKFGEKLRGNSHSNEDNKSKNNKTSSKDTNNLSINVQDIRNGKIGKKLANFVNNQLYVKTEIYISSKKMKKEDILNGRSLSSEGLSYKFWDISNLNLENKGLSSVFEDKVLSLDGENSTRPGQNTPVPGFRCFSRQTLPYNKSVRKTSVFSERPVFTPTQIDDHFNLMLQNSRILPMYSDEVRFHYLSAMLQEKLRTFVWDEFLRHKLKNAEHQIFRENWSLEALPLFMVEYTYKKKIGQVRTF